MLVSEEREEWEMRREAVMFVADGTSVQSLSTAE